MSDNPHCIKLKYIKVYSNFCFNRVVCLYEITSIF